MSKYISINKGLRKWKLYMIHIYRYVNIHVIHMCDIYKYGSPGDLVVKNLPAMQEIRTQSLAWKDTLVEGIGTHSSLLTWRIPWTEEPGELHSMGFQRAGHD